MTQFISRVAILGVVLLTGPGLVFGGQPKKPQPPQLTSHQIQTLGEGVFPDAGSYLVFGAEGLKEIALQLRDAQNATLMRSGRLPVHLVLTQVAPVPQDVTAHGLGVVPVLMAAQKSKQLASLAAPRGTDLLFLWVNTQASGEAFVPGRVADFNPRMGFAYAPTRGILSQKLHEVWHLFGCQHNPEASQTPGRSTWPTAVGFLSANGTCDAVSYCSSPEPIFSGPGITYDGVGYGDTSHDNAGQVRRAAGWLAAYNPIFPVSIEKGECQEGVESACIQGMQVQVQWASAAKVADEESSFDGSARKASSGGETATFEVAGRSLQVSLARRTVRMGHRQVTVTDLTIAATRAPLVRRVIITPASGQAKVWEVGNGEVLNLSVPAAF